VAGRFHALDRLRALAVLSMVQGHTFTALLADDALPGWAMQLHALVHGVTAPAFLCGAGLAFGLATYPRYALHQRGRALWPRLRRYGWLFVIGYALQLPGSSLFTALRMPFAELTPVFRVGPLHLVAFCLLLCQLGALVVRTPRVHGVAALALGCGITAGAPLVYAADAGRRAGPVLGPWLDASSGSLFPIFPWASFVFFGVAAGALLAVRAELPRPRIWLLPGLALLLASYAMFRLGVRLSDPRWFWHASPLHVLFRLGVVACLLGLLHRLPTRAAEAHAPGSTAALGGASDDWTSLLARHSLVAFVVHLLLLYGTPFTPNLTRHWGRTLGAAEASLVFVAILALTLLAVRAWARLSEGRRLEHGLVRAMLTTLGVLVLIR
jgi:hypothetical protein